MRNTEVEKFVIILALPNTRLARARLAQQSGAGLEIPAPQVFQTGSEQDQLTLGAQTPVYTQPVQWLWHHKA